MLAPVFLSTALWAVLFFARGRKAVSGDVACLREGVDAVPRAGRVPALIIDPYVPLLF